MTQEDPWVMYLIVRESLGMSPGKVGAQCGHVVESMSDYYWEAKIDSDRGFYLVLAETEEDRIRSERVKSMAAWKANQRTKIVKGADEKEWAKVKETFSEFIVIDAGHTEVAPDTETVIGLWPMLKSETPKLIKRLQLLHDKSQR